MDSRSTEQVVLDTIANINAAGYDKATRRQIERWNDELAEDLGDVLARLLEQGKISYSNGAYQVN